MSKNVSNRKIKILILIIMTIVLIVIFSIYKYNTYCLIYYVENEPPAGTTIWNTALTVRVKVLNNGTLIYNNEKDKLEEDELKEIRQLVSQLKEKVKELKQDNSAVNRFTINNRTYAVNSLDSEGREIILQIRNIVY